MRNSLIDRQTLWRLSSGCLDANFRLQVTLVKLAAMIDEAIPDEVFTEVGSAIAQLRAAASKLETFVLTLSERSA